MGKIPKKTDRISGTTASDMDEQWNRLIHPLPDPITGLPQDWGKQTVNDEPAPETDADPVPTDMDRPGATQQIHREDPQAGYDPVAPRTELNGIVSRNPKDGRNEADQ